MFDGIRAYLREIKHTKKSHKGNFLKKVSLKSSKIFRYFATALCNFKFEVAEIFNFNLTIIG